jgi:DNA-binding MarR family transcriptional regulator
MMHRLVGTHASEFTEVGITMAQAKVLYVVMAADQLRMSELAARLGIGSSSASELADRLVELGLLERHTDADDRRQVVVTTTPAAEALLEQFRELNLRQLRDLLSRLDPGELAIVERSMGILDAAIDRAAAASTGDPSVAPTRPSTARPHKSETRP